MLPSFIGNDLSMQESVAKKVVCIGYLLIFGDCTQKVSVVLSSFLLEVAFKVVLFSSLHLSWQPAEVCTDFGSVPARTGPGPFAFLDYR